MSSGITGRFAAIATAALAGVLFFGCDKSTGPAGAEEGRKSLAMSIAIGEAHYFGTSTPDGRTENGDGFFEHELTCGAVRYGEWLFILEQMEGGNVYRYTMDESNNLTGPEKLSFGILQSVRSDNTGL